MTQDPVHAAGPADAAGTAQPAVSRRRFLGLVGATAAAGSIAAACSSSSTAAKKAGAVSAGKATTTLPTTTTVAKPAIPPNLVPGALRPPQLVMISFDGSGATDLMQYWRDVAQRNNAKFSFFISGVYLLLPENKTLYTPPGRKPGDSSIGFFSPGKDSSGTRKDAKVDLHDLLNEWKAAHLEGHEIGTHYNGHFCGTTKAVGQWSADDWTNEITQFKSFLANVTTNNGLPTVDLPFGPNDIKGGRTPCLEGKLDVLYPVLAAQGMTFDSSRVASEGVWPSKINGVWSLPLHDIELVGSKLRTLTMDYNFYAQQWYLKTGQMTPQPITDPALRDGMLQQTYDSYKKYFLNAYHGRRAPMVIGHHFARWNQGVYVEAITRLIDEISKLPEVYFVTKSQTVDWLNTQSPVVLDNYRTGVFDKLTA